MANPAVTLLADTETIVSGVSTALDGKIVVVGYGSSGVLASGHRRFRLARLRPDGVLDPAFGRHGMTLAKMRSSIWVSDAARALALQNDGRIVVTGSAGYPTGPLCQAAYCATARFNQDGRLDRNFGDKGRVLTLLPGETSCGGVAVFVAPDGEIIVVSNACGGEQQPIPRRPRSRASNARVRSGQHPVRSHAHAQLVRPSLDRVGDDRMAQQS